MSDVELFRTVDLSSQDERALIRSRSILCDREAFFTVPSSRRPVLRPKVLSRKMGYRAILLWLYAKCIPGWENITLSNWILQFQPSFSPDFLALFWENVILTSLDYQYGSLNALTNLETMDDVRALPEKGNGDLLCRTFLTGTPFLDLFQSLDSCVMGELLSFVLETHLTGTANGPCSLLFQAFMQRGRYLQDEEMIWGPVAKLGETKKRKMSAC